MERAWKPKHLPRVFLFSIVHGKLCPRQYPKLPYMHAGCYDDSKYLYKLYFEYTAECTSNSLGLNRHKCQSRILRARAVFSVMDSGLGSRFRALDQDDFCRFLLMEETRA